MSIQSVMPSNNLILCYPLLLLPSVFPSIKVFSNESAVRIRWPKYRSFSFNISPSNEYSGLISFRIDCLISLQSKGLLRIFSSTTVQKHHLESYRRIICKTYSYFKTTHTGTSVTSLCEDQLKIYPKQYWYWKLPSVPIHRLVAYVKTSFCPHYKTVNSTVLFQHLCKSITDFACHFATFPFPCSDLFYKMMV